MASLRTLTQDCSKCNLCKNMTISPVAIEMVHWQPKLLVVVGVPVKLDNDLSQEVISGVDRGLLDKVLSTIGIPYALTFQVKCKSENGQYKKGDYKTCDWVKKEIEQLSPRFVVGMGKFKYSDIKFDLITESPARVFVNKKKTDLFKSELEAIINDFP